MKDILGDSEFAGESGIIKQDFLNQLTLDNKTEEILKEIILRMSFNGHLDERMTVIEAQKIIRLAFNELAGQQKLAISLFTEEEVSQISLAEIPVQLERPEWRTSEEYYDAKEIDRKNFIDGFNKCQSEIKSRINLVHQPQLKPESIDWLPDWRIKELTGNLYFRLNDVWNNEGMSTTGVISTFLKEIQSELQKRVKPIEESYTKQDLIDLVQSLKNYTHESHNILGHDEREASEFVDIFIETKKGNQ